MTRKELEEVAVDGMFKAEQWSSFWSREDAAALVRAALSAIEGAGFAVVPVVPTTDPLPLSRNMARSGAAALWEIRNRGTIGLDEACEVWSAMLSASKG